MKKLLYLLLFIPLVFACSDDGNNDGPSGPTNFFEAHNGVWTTTFSDGSQTLFDIYDDGWDTYWRPTNSGCWAIPSSVGGTATTTTIILNTPDELVGETINIPASNLFTGDELEILLDAGYTTVSIYEAYLHTSSTMISFGITYYAGNFEEELFSLYGNLIKQNWNSFSVCREMSNKYYNSSEEALARLNK